MEFLSFGERCISPIIIVFQMVLRGKQKNPFNRRIGNFAGGIFLLSGGNLTRSEFDKDYKFNIKMVQQRWLQLKKKSLWGSNMKIFFHMGR